MTVRRVDHQHIDAGLDERGDTFVGSLAHADRGADAQLALGVLAGVRMLAFLQDVLDGDEPLELEVAVDHQHALEAVLVHELHRLVPAGAIAHRDQLALRRHDRLHRLVELGFEAQVAVGNDADHLPGLDHREARDLVLLLQRDHLAHGHLRRNGHRVAQHARLEALDLRNLCRLRLRSEILVDDADPAFLRDGDRQARLRDRIHGGRDERDVQLELSGETGLQGDFARQDARVGGKEENVVEGQRLLDHPHQGFLFSQSGILHESV